MNAWNKKIVSLFMAVLMLPIFGFIIQPKSNNISLFFSLPKWNLVLQKNGCYNLQIKDWICYPNLQGYLLPRRLIKIQIPREYEYNGFTILSSDKIISSEKIKLTKSEGMSIINSKGIIQTSFSGNSPDLLTYVGTETENSIKQVLLVICPFTFDSRTMHLSYVASFRISISLKKTTMDKQFNSSVDIRPGEKYNYCIILPKAKIPLFQEYKSFFEDRGIQTVLYPLEEIYATYQLSNNPCNIRTFLKDYYLNHGIETVLLVGSISTIPMKKFFPNGNKNEEPILSDLYYSELSTPWDDNPYLGKLETDLKDFDPEIAIGRLPMDNDQEITDYLSRILTYYQTIDQRKKSILCAGAWISFKEDDGIVFSSDMFDIDGGNMTFKKYQTYFPTYSYEGFFEQEGEKKSLVASNGNAINYTNVKGSIWQTNPLIQLLSGHGNYSGIYRKIWSSDKNRNGTAETDEVTFDRFYDEKTPSSSSLYLVDSCSTCQPDQSNLGMQTIKKAGGGYLGFAGEVYFIVTSTCKDPCDFEASTSIYGITGVTAKYLNQQVSIGECTKKSLKHYRDLCFVSLDKTITQYQAKNLYSACYYGDPYMRLSGYPVKDFNFFVSQGKAEGNKSAYGIQDVSVSKASQYDTWKIRAIDPIKSGKNYLYTFSIDSNKDQVMEYSYKVGYLNKDNFVQNFYQNNQFKSIFGRYGFRYEANDFWIQLPRSILGNSYRYQISLTNIETNQTDNFLGSFPKEDSPPAPPPKETVPPKPPLISKSLYLDKRIKLEWIPSQQGTFPIAGYEIFRKEDTSEYSLLSIEDSKISTYIDQFVIPGKLYFYRIRSFDNQTPRNLSSYSNEVSISIPLEDKPPPQIIPPTAPVISELQNINSRVYLKWSASIAGTFSIGGYEIYRKEDSLSYKLIAINDASTLLFTDQLVVEGKTYYYQIRGFDNQAPSNFSSFSAEKSITLIKNNPPEEPKPPTILPPSPPILKGTYQYPSFSNHLIWSKSMDGTFPVAGYYLFRSDPNHTTALYKTLDSFSFDFLDTQLEEQTIYTYHIQAFDNQTPPHLSLSSNFVSLQVANKPKPAIVIRLKIGSNIAIIGNRFIVLPIEPFTYKDRTMVPIRFIGEAFGAKVTWTEDDSKNGEGIIEIYLLKSDKTEIFITFHTLETKALFRVYKNGGLLKDQVIQMDVPAFIVKPANRTVVPIRFIAETFDANVRWDESNEEINIEFIP